MLHWRKQLQRPLHSPHHVDGGQCHYLITASCFEHKPHIGLSVNRMNEFASELLNVLHQHSLRVVAWVVLPNHYHALVSSKEVLPLLSTLGQLHGRSSFRWNGEEQIRGRKVWYNATETVMKSDAHYYASLNYVHHNPVKHRYVTKWTDWPWSSAAAYLAEAGREEAERLWKSYPIDVYGAGWDDADL